VDILKVGWWRYVAVATCVWARTPTSQGPPRRRSNRSRTRAFSPTCGFRMPRPIGRWAWTARPAVGPAGWTARPDGGNAPSVGPSGFDPRPGGFGPGGPAWVWPAPAPDDNEQTATKRSRPRPDARFGGRPGGDFRIAAPRNRVRQDRGH